MASISITSGSFKEFRTRDLGAFNEMLTEDQEFSSIRPLIDWLDYNGYTVITKTIKEFVDPVGRRKLKGDMNVELAIQAMELAQYMTTCPILGRRGNGVTGTK